MPSAAGGAEKQAQPSLEAYTPESPAPISQACASPEVSLQSSGKILYSTCFPMACMCTACQHMTSAVPSWGIQHMSSPLQCPGKQSRHAVIWLLGHCAQTSSAAKPDAARGGPSALPGRPAGSGAAQPASDRRRRCRMRHVSLPPALCVQRHAAMSSTLGLAVSLPCLSDCICVSILSRKEEHCCRDAKTIACCAARCQLCGP